MASNATAPLCDEFYCDQIEWSDVGPELGGLIVATAVSSFFALRLFAQVRDLC